MTILATHFENAPQIHAFIEGAPEVWEYVAAMQAGHLTRENVAAALGLDASSFDWLLDVADERMKRLARRHAN